MENLAPEPVRALIRMGYVIKAANDDGGGRPMVVITERGRDWLKNLGRRQP